MSSRSRIHKARRDVATVQSALASVQTGLDVAETAAEAAGEVRRCLRRTAKIGVLVVVVGVIAVIVMSKRSDPATDET